MTETTPDDRNVVTLTPRQPPPLELPGPDDEPPPYDDAPPEDLPPAATTPPRTDTRSNDQDAEQQVLGAAMLDARTSGELAETLTGQDFWNPAHETIWHAIITLRDNGDPITAITVADHLQATLQLTNIGGRTYLHTLISGIPTAANALHYADILRRHTTRRRLQATITRLAQMDAAGTNTNDTIAAALTALEHITATNTNSTQQRAEEVHDFLSHATEDDPPDWLIPELLEHGDRLIITAAEGHGKSTLLRQIGVQTAAGVHPFTLETMPPARVLIVDLENSERQTRRELRPLTIAAHGRLNRDQLHVACKIDGLDLATPDGTTWLDQAITQTRPDLLITGPIYKMATGNPNEEKEAKPIAMALDRLRARHGIAVILEAHSAKTPAGINPKNRPKEPFGWSGWMRWPDFGLHLGEDGTLTPWRGGRDQHTRTWPHILNRGGTWPWTPGQLADTTPGARWIKIRGAIIRAGGQRLSAGQIATQIGSSKPTVARDLAAHAIEINALYAQIEENA